MPKSSGLWKLEVWQCRQQLDPGALPQAGAPLARVGVLSEKMLEKLPQDKIWRWEQIKGQMGAGSPWWGAQPAHVRH